MALEAHLPLYDAPTLPSPSHSHSHYPVSFFSFLFRIFICFPQGPAFAICIHTENQDQASFRPSAPWALFHFLHGMHLTLNFLICLFVYMFIFSLLFGAPGDRVVWFQPRLSKRKKKKKDVCVLRAGWLQAPRHHWVPFAGPQGAGQTAQGLCPGAAAAHGQRPGLAARGPLRQRN